METTLKVTGMNCGACVSHVTKTLQGVEGVQVAAVDLASGIATVKHGENAKPEAMVEAVNEAGYNAEVKGHTA